MAISIGIILILGLLGKGIFEKMRLPGLLGLLILGIIIGPYGFNLLKEDFLLVSGDLRKLALIIILLRAGLGINKTDLQRVGFSAIKLSFIPGIFEGLFIALISRKFLNFTFIQGGILGFILAAVSPAVVVPSMLSLMTKRLGEKKGIPTLILAGASMDDVVAITIFTAFIGFYRKTGASLLAQLLNIPISIGLGILLGLIIAYGLVVLFRRFDFMDTNRLLILMGVAILLTELENLLKGKIEIAALIGVITMAFIIKERLPKIGKEISRGLNKVWIFAEMLLFVLIGAEVNIFLAIKGGRLGILIILLGLLARSLGVWISLLGTSLNKKERLFCIISYTPKATVQAAIGAIPLSMGVDSGDLILAIAVLSILITAPLGAIGIELSAPKLLEEG